MMFTSLITLPLITKPPHGGGGATVSGKATNRGVFPRENFGFPELGKTSPRLLTRVFEQIRLPEI